MYRFQIGNCSGVTVLSLRSNFLQRLPEEIGLIAQLRVLNVSGNRLRNLPLAIAKLKNLQALWLVENQTAPLPQLQNDVDYVDSPVGVRVFSCPLLPQTGDSNGRLMRGEEGGSSDNNNNNPLLANASAAAATAAVPKPRRNASARPANGFVNAAWTGSNGAIAPDEFGLQAPVPASVANASATAFGAPPYMQPPLFPTASAAYQQRIDPMNPVSQSKRTRSTPGHYSDSEVCLRFFHLESA